MAIRLTNRASHLMDVSWYVNGMTMVSMDPAGRVVIPKPVRDRLGLVAGATFDLIEQGSDLILATRSPGATIEERSGVLVIESQRPDVFTDDDLYALRDAGRR